VIVPQDAIDFTKYIVPKGYQPGETALPEINENTSTALPPLNETAYDQLQQMGFSHVRAEKALRMTGNGPVDVAMEWLMNHISDPDIDVPFTPEDASSSIEGFPLTDFRMENLMSMGFVEEKCRKALQETVSSHVAKLNVVR
jgi:ubiquitin carboxyl-terminal hydrolase 5/13